ncbi:MAG: hypothetical protein GKR89_18250 [Candidatus Latescibacteria bacterium]|nr:hypothetical protein [Candidatus Latescibacterota bacterium]
MKVSRAGRKILVDGYLPEGTNKVQIQLWSSRNAKISRMSDISRDNPDVKTSARPTAHDVSGKRLEGEITYANGGELWYPVVDIQLDWSMHGTAVLHPNAEGRYAINGMYHRKSSVFNGNIEIPARELEHWENSLCMQPAEVPLNGFFITSTITVIPSIQRRLQHELTLLTEDWQGKVIVLGADEGAGEIIATAKIEAPAAHTEGGVGPHTDLNRALAATVDYVLNSQNTNAFSPTLNGLYLFYDLAAKTYRNANWIWSWGPAVKLLLEYAKSDARNKAHSKDHLVAKADAIGMTSTRFQIDNPGHVTDGLGSPRWQTEHRSGAPGEFGYVELISGGADANFLAGWAWIPLYEKTGNEHYLACARKLAESTSRLINQYDIIPQDYISEIGDWTDRTVNESVFGMEGLSELYRVTREEEHRSIGETYIEQHINKLLREDGLWDFGYSTRTGERPLIKNTRGMGWVMEGLLASHRMMPEGKYLALADRLADHIIEWQHPSGYFTCVFDRPSDKVGIDDKSTPLWSLLLYRLYKHTHGQKHLDAARRALHWCVDNLYTDSDCHAQGGLVGINNFSGVSYRRWFPLTCLYSSAFLGLALLEEMRLRDDA